MLSDKEVGFVGGGNMGEALIRGLLVSTIMEPSQIRVSDINQERLEYLQSTYQVQTTAFNGELAASADVIVLAVKPQQMAGVLAEINSSIDHLPLVISIAAGVGLNFLQRTLGKPVPLVRVMPNTPALVLAGVSAMAAGIHATAEHLSMVRALLEAVGRVVEVDEAHMDAVTGLSGSGPAYVYLFMEALIDSGVLVGLPRRVARDLVVQTTLGAAKLLAETDAHPGTLKDQITTPGGTAINGLAVLERGGFRGVLMEAVAAASRRSEELGKR
jgi:pyrroline-5-carboxylate reductase